MGRPTARITDIHSCPKTGPGPGTGALIGAGVGAVGGAVVGACVGGPVGALIGAAIGAVGGAIVGAIVGAIFGNIPHVGGPIIGPGCATVVICKQLAACVGDSAKCEAPDLDVLVQGSKTVLFGGRQATRFGDATQHGGQITSGCATVLIGKILYLRIVIIKGSFWDTPAGRAAIEQQLREAERLLDLKIVTGPFDTIDDPALLQFDKGWNGGGETYSAEQLDAVNRLGAPNRPVAIFTNDSGDGAALGVSRGWQGNRPVGNEGILVGQNGNFTDNVTAHELGHMLSNESAQTHNETDPTNLMDPHAAGDNWTDPWRSSAERNPYLN